MAAEAKPGSLETVHHILVFVQPPGSGGGFLRSRWPRQSWSQAEEARAKGAAKGREGNPARALAPVPVADGGGGIESGNMIAGYAAGMNPLLNTDGTTAMLVKAGSKLDLPNALHPQRHAGQRSQLCRHQVRRPG